MTNKQVAIYCQRLGANVAHQDGKTIISSASFETFERCQDVLRQAGIPQVIGRHDGEFEIIVGFCTN